MVPERTRSNLLIRGDVRNALTHAPPFWNPLVNIWAGQGSHTLQEVEALI